MSNKFKIILDCETTGFTENKILQLGMFILQENNTKLYNKYFSTDSRIEGSAISVHGITKDFLAKTATNSFEEEIDKLYPYFMQAEEIIGYNVDYDVNRCINPYLRKRGLELIDTNKCICMMKAYSEIIQKSIITRRVNSSLINSFNFYITLGIKTLEEIEEKWSKLYPYKCNDHNAIYDVYKTYILYSELEKVKRVVNKNESRVDSPV